MPTFLLVFEFLGTTELLVIAVVALLIFGPRKLPEIGRTIGRSLAEFKRASEDFKRTWEYEVEMERSEREVRAGQGEAVARAALVEDNALGAGLDAPSEVEDAAPFETEERTIARSAADASSPADGVAAPAGAADEDASGGKKDWL